MFLNKSVIRLLAKSLKGNTQAFTLLEVMIAISILAVSFAALYGSQSRSLSYAAESIFNTHAPLLASMKLAELKAEDEEIIDGDGDFGDDYLGYSWTIETEEASFDDSELLADLSIPIQKITMTISWTEASFSYTSVSYIAQEE